MNAIQFNEKLELKARDLHQRGDLATAQMLLKAAQIIDAGRMIREGLTKESSEIQVTHYNSISSGILCWDQLLGGK